MRAGGCPVIVAQWQSTSCTSQRCPGSVNSQVHRLKCTVQDFYLPQDLMSATVQSTNLKSCDTQVLDIMQKAILATDLARFFGSKEQFQAIITSGEFSWENDQHR